MKQHIDQLNRTLSFKTTPKRIVSLVPSQTELLHDLGLEESIVGITKFDIHPAHYLKTKTIVGGTKQVHFDKIKALKPDIILCNKEENTKEMVLELEKIAPVHISDIFTFDDVFELFKQYGALFDIVDKAEVFSQQLNNELTSFQAFISNRPIQRVAYFIWKKPWMVAGGNNIINHLLGINKFDNCFSDTPRYPEIQLEELSNQNLDILLLSSEPYPFADKHIQELKVLLPEVKIVLVDGEYFSWYGTRLIKAFSYYKELHNSLT